MAVGYGSFFRPPGGNGSASAGVPQEADSLSWPFLAGAVPATTAPRPPWQAWRKWLVGPWSQPADADKQCPRSAPPFAAPGTYRHPGAR